MNQQTLELLRALQSSERDAQAFEHIRGLLASQRSHLVAEDDRATLADLSELLEVWAETATPELASAATACAADIADEDLEQAERAVQLYVLSLERAPGASEPLERLDALLCRRGERERLESILAMHAKVLRERAEVDPERAGAVLRRLGELRVERGGDLNGAIDAYEQAIDLAADPETIRTLADLYAKRSAPGDDVQAADLYCTLGDVMGAPDGAPMLERALDQAPGHDAALDLLESYVPVAEQAARLKQRWSAYVERSDNENGVDKRRLLLARAHSADGQHREALICIGPLIDKGEPEALRLQAAFLANLHEEQSQPPPAPDASAATAAAKSGNGASVKRPATLVGFRLPPGEGVPEVAQPAPADAPAAYDETADDGGEESGTDVIGDPAQIAASARNAFAARSGETLVGFRMPTGKTSGPVEIPGKTSGQVEPPPGASAKAAPGAPAASAAAGDAESHAFDERDSGERTRESGVEPAPPQSAQATASSGMGARAPSSGTAARAAARASGGPAALSAALSAGRTSSSPGSQPAVSARSASGSSPGRISAAAAESPAAKAAALKAGRSSAPSASSNASFAAAARRASSPPPLRRSSGPSPASAVSAQPRAFGGPAALAATLPMPGGSAVAAQPAVQAAVPFAAPGAPAAPAPQPIAPAVLPRVQALDTDVAAFASRKRKIDPRWLAAGGVAAVAVIIGLIWTSGDDGAEPAPSDASRVEATPAGAAVGTSAATPTPSVPATPPPAPAAAPAPAAPAAATAAAPSSSAAATLAAAVTTNTPSAPAPSSSRRARDPEVDVGAVRVRGGLAAKAVTEAVDDGLGKLESCYADAIDRKPSLAGKLTFSFSIDKSGKATRVRKQSGTIKDAALQRCSSEAIEKMRFPKAKKRAAQVTLPLEYSR